MAHEDLGEEESAADDIVAGESDEDIVAGESAEDDVVAHEAAEDDVVAGGSTAQGPGPVRSGIRVTTIAGVVAVAALLGLCGLLGYRLVQAREAERFRHELVEVAKQGALNLTTIDYKHADADVQRILDSSTGAFYDDFKARSGPFTDVVKKMKSTSVGTVAEAGVIPESVSRQEGQVLVAVTVKTANDGAPEEQPRYWRMRLTVTKQGDQEKVSNVEFVS
jgi:Mce-associated membrane protein